MPGERLDGGAARIRGRGNCPSPCSTRRPNSLLSQPNDCPAGHRNGHAMLAPTAATHVFPFDNSYARLPERFFARLPPTPVAAPCLIRLNEVLARQLRLDAAGLSAPEG